MKLKGRKTAVLVFSLLCMLLMLPMSASAAKLKKYNVDKYTELGKNYTVIAYNPNNRWVHVRNRKNTRASAFGSINYGGALIVNTKGLKNGVKTSWIPVYMHNRKTKTGWRTGYVLASQVRLKTLNTRKFSNNRTINKAIKVGFKYLGTPFVMPGASLSRGIDCAQFVKAVYRSAGKNLVSWAHTDNLQRISREVFYQRKHRTLSKRQLNKLKAGDLLFYLKNDTSGPVDHVGIYIGEGFMINSSGHYGSVYPNGGICIKRVQYGSRKMVRAMRVRGI